MDAIAREDRACRFPADAAMALRLLHDRAAPGADGTARPVRGVADLGGAMAAITIAAAGGCGHRLAGRHGLTQRAKTGGMSER